MPIEICVDSEDLDVPLEQIHKGCEILLSAMNPPDPELTLLFTDNKKIRELNKEFRNLDKATDVLSWSYGDDSDFPDSVEGEIAISVEYASREAEERGHSLEKELWELIVHGIVHIEGPDHEIESEVERFSARADELKSLLKENYIL